MPAKLPDAIFRSGWARVEQETRLPVHLTESPLTCVAVGAGHSLEEFHTLERSGDIRRRRKLPLGRRSTFSRTS